MESEPYKVVIRLDDENRVVAINSSEFVDGDDWVQIDEGHGDRYHHAQNNYLDKPIADYRGVYRYKYIDGQIVERTQEEMDTDYASRPAPEPTAEEKEKTLMNAKIQALTDRNEFLEDCVAEMAAIVYA